ncbi:hypothetical protein [Nostocoides australiense]
MLAELQVQFATVPIVFAENRALAQEWTYRFLGAAADESRSREAADVRWSASSQPEPG